MALFVFLSQKELRPTNKWRTIENHARLVAISIADLVAHTQVVVAMLTMYVVAMGSIATFVYLNRREE